MNPKIGLIRHRMSKARDTLEDAEILYERIKLNSAVNRIYYAVFHEVTALLITQGLASRKHIGMMALFNRHFVKPGKVSREAGKFYGKAFEFRQESDYGDYVVFNRDEVGVWIQKAKAFLGELDILIEENIKNMI